MYLKYLDKKYNFKIFLVLYLILYLGINLGLNSGKNLEIYIGTQGIDGSYSNKLSEGYGVGKGNGTTQVNFGKDSEITETTSHGAMIKQPFFCKFHFR